MTPTPAPGSDSGEAASFVGLPDCAVCQQYNLAKRIMEQIDAQGEFGSALYDGAITDIYNAADEALHICRHEHVTEPTKGN